jgi:hypothetical protein
MKFKTLQGSLKRVPKIKKYLIDWEESSKSKLQYSVKSFLHEYWKNNVVFEEFPVAGTRLSLDFYNASKSVAIEVQGAQHRRYVSHFHGGHKLNYLDQIRRDKQKLEFCDLNGIKLIEVYDTDKLSKELFLDLGLDL